MSEPFLGEIRLLSFGFAPKNWALCDGQVLSIAQNQALFALLGTMYGGNGVQNFALPNLQGRIPLHRSASYSQGSFGGEEAHTLTANEIPAHTHGVIASSNGPSQPSPLNGFWPTGGTLTPYASANNSSAMGSQAVATIGGQPHENRPPFLVINFAIALAGIFPSRS
jgi:microcystin-dependent protein